MPVFNGLQQLMVRHLSVCMVCIRLQKIEPSCDTNLYACISHGQWRINLRGLPAKGDLRSHEPGNPLARQRLREGEVHGLVAQHRLPRPTPGKPHL